MPIDNDFSPALEAAAKMAARQRGHFSEADIQKCARAICQERCAFMGELPCWRHADEQGKPLPWPAPACDDPGCIALAMAALTAVHS
jgi:hypothetical protein